MFFQSFGEEVLNTISDFATQASTALIDEIRIPLLTCLTIYFLIKGYLITYGRIESPLSDFILTAGKIVLVTYFGLNALNYVNDVIPAIRGLESMLVNVLRLPGSPDITTQGAWGAIDRMWAELMIVNDKALAIAGKVSVMSSFGTWFALFLLGVLMSIISVALTFAATGVLIINEIALTLTLAFGPLFICCLMFPVVRSWFDGWIKAVATYLFGAVMVAAVILLVTKIFSSFSADLLTSLENYEKRPTAYHRMASRPEVCRSRASTHITRQTHSEHRCGCRRRRCISGCRSRTDNERHLERRPRHRWRLCRWHWHRSRRCRNDKECQKSVYEPGWIRRAWHCRCRGGWSGLRKFIPTWTYVNESRQK